MNAGSRMSAHSQGLKAGVPERPYRDLGRFVTIAASIFPHMAEPCVS